MNQIIPLTKQLNDLNNKLGSQITCERKSRANLNTKQLKEIESLKSEINLKDFEITSFEARINELEADVSDLEDELEQISLKPDSSSNDSKTGGDAVEEVSGFSKILSFSSHHSEPEHDESKVKDVVEPLIDYVCNKQKEKLDNIQALPIVTLG
ncbi:26000_t:CDS:2, partial [Racocetra persica]